MTLEEEAREFAYEAGMTPKNRDDPENDRWECSLEDLVMFLALCRSSVSD
jgi:hypothetical protein